VWGGVVNGISGEMSRGRRGPG